MTIRARHWLAALAIAIAVHCAILLSWRAEAPAQVRSAAGAGGIEISLGAPGGVPAAVPAVAEPPPPVVQAVEHRAETSAIAPPDARPVATPPIDAVPIDAVPIDAVPIDAVPIDAVPGDVAVQVEPVKPAPVEARPIRPAEPTSIRPPDAVQAVPPDEHVAARVVPPARKPPARPRPQVAARPAPPRAHVSAASPAAPAPATTAPAALAPATSAPAMSAPATPASAATAAAGAPAGMAGVALGGGAAPARPGPPGPPPSDYIGRLQAWLARHKEYPSEARRLGQEGTALLHFSIDRSGRVLAARLQRSSGHAVLDREVLAMIRRADPLPPLPPVVDRERLDLVVPVQFLLR